MPITSLMREKLILEVLPFCTGLTFTIKRDHSYSIQIDKFGKSDPQSNDFAGHIRRFSQILKNFAKIAKLL